MRSPSPTTATGATDACSRSSSRSPGKRIDSEYAENRRRWEPLYEVTQMKGTRAKRTPSCRPDGEPPLEIWDKGNLDVSAGQEARDAGILVRALRVQERPEAGSGTSASTPTSSGWSDPPMRTPRSRPSKSWGPG